MLLSSFLWLLFVALVENIELMPVVRCYIGMSWKFSSPYFLLLNLLCSCNISYCYLALFFLMLASSDIRNSYVSSQHYWNHKLNHSLKPLIIAAGFNPNTQLNSNTQTKVLLSRTRNIQTTAEHRPGRLQNRNMKWGVSSSFTIFETKTFWKTSHSIAS